MKASLRPTPFGAALLTLSLLLGGLGTLREELAALLWGTAFLGLGVVCFIGCLATILLIRGGGGRAEPPLETLPFDGTESAPGETLEGFWPLPVPRKLPPGIFLFGELTYRCGRRVLKGLGGVELHRGGAEIGLSSPLRGDYRGTGRLLCRDALGLFQGAFALPGEGRLCVFPPLVSGDAGTSPSSPGGEETAENRNLQRSRELFDLRKYTPGDDPRRMHWKLFAHLEELFLRQGEDTPPPRGEFPVYLDLSAPGLTPSPLMDAFLDKILGRFALWGGALLEKGGVLLLSEKAGRPAARFSPGEEVKLLRYLAQLSWQVPGPLREAAEYPRIFFLTTPLSEDWELRLAELEGPKRRGGAALLVPAVFELDTPPPSPLDVLLFRDAPGTRASGKEAALLAERGRSLLKRLEEKHPPGGVLVF